MSVVHAAPADRKNTIHDVAAAQEGEHRVQVPILLDRGRLAAIPTVPGLNKIRTKND